jgi:hypothetical protein
LPRRAAFRRVAVRVTDALHYCSRRARRLLPARIGLLHRPLRLLMPSGVALGARRCSTSQGPLARPRAASVLSPPARPLAPARRSGAARSSTAPPFVWRRSPTQPLARAPLPPRGAPLLLRAAPRAPARTRAPRVLGRWPNRAYDPAERDHPRSERTRRWHSSAQQPRGCRETLAIVAEREPAGYGGGVSLLL